MDRSGEARDAEAPPSPGACPNPTWIEDGRQHSKQRSQEQLPQSRFDAYLDDPPSCELWSQERVECPTCGKRGRFYCPDCVSFVGKPDAVNVPEGLRLPLQVDVIVTAQERRRSSGVHVAVVAPQSIRVVPFDESEDGLPDYEPGSDLVVFPSVDSLCWEDFSAEEVAAARRIVLIDSRWETTGVVVNHPKLRGLRHVRIKYPPARSRFWRWHISGEGHICTAEATYFVLRDYEAVSGVSTEGGPLEDIMFMFALMHSRIKEAYAKEPSKAGQAEPSTEAAKRRRRARSVKLEKLVKAKYKGLEDVRQREGEDAAVEEFCRRRKGISVYKTQEHSETFAGEAYGRVPSEEEGESGLDSDYVLDR